MNIAFDAWAFSYGSKERGMGRYTFNLIRQMVFEHQNHQYYFFNTINSYSLAKDLKYPANFHETILDTGRNQFIEKEDGFLSIYGDLLRCFIKDNHIDVFYMTSPFDPKQRVYQHEWFDDVMLCATVYDLIPLLFKEHYLKDPAYRKDYFSKLELLKQCDHLFAISDATKEDVIRELGYAADHITTIYGAADMKLVLADSDQSSSESTMKKFGIRHDYILYVGGEDYRKNVDTLVHGYCALPAKIKHSYQLVIAGKLSEKSNDSLCTYAAERHDKHNLVLTGYISDEEMSCLYRNASLMAFPSKYEGFGMPILEAWQCGLPVLTSNNSSCREIAGDAAVLIDADSAESIKEGFQTILNPEMLREYAARGKERAKLYQWNIVADHLNDGLQLCKKPMNQPGRRKLALLVGSRDDFNLIYQGYLLNAVKHLGNSFDLQIFAEGSAQAVIEKATANKCRSLTEYHKNQFDISLFDVFDRSGLARLSKYIQGSCDIVDLNCASSVKNNIYTLNSHDDDKDEIVLLEGADRSSDLDSLSEHIHRAGGVIVHSEHVKKILLSGNPFQRIRVIPYDDSTCEQTIDADTPAMIQGNVQIASFDQFESRGFLNIVIPAIRELADKGTRFEYHIYEADRRNDDLIAAEVQKYSLSDYIVIHRNDEENSVQNVSEDYIISLRNKWDVQNAVQVAYWLKKGKRVLVNDEGAYHDLPTACCLKVSGSETVSKSELSRNIAGRLYDCIMDRVEQNMITFHAKKYVDDYLINASDAGRIAEAINEFLSADFHPTKLADLCRRVESDSYSDDEKAKIADTIAAILNFKGEYAYQGDFSVVDVMNQIKQELGGNTL